MFKFCQPQSKRTFVSTANKPLVGTLMTIGDVMVSIAISNTNITYFPIQISSHIIKINRVELCF